MKDFTDHCIPGDDAEGWLDMTAECDDCGCTAPLNTDWLCAACAADSEVRRFERWSHRYAETEGGFAGEDF